MKLEGMTALVTGAASGLGAATAAMLAGRGVQVLGVDLQRSIEAAGEQAEGIRLVAADVTSESEVSAALAALDGLPPLRLVVNCAGIAPAQRILSSKGVHDLETFQRTLNINLVGTFNVMRLAAEHMSALEPVDESGQRGVVVNTASVAAYEGQIGQIAYAASKGGVVAMGITAARDLARNGIRVNTVAPGIVHTPLLEALGEEVNASLAAAVPFPARLARPDEFAQLVAMIAEHDYLNGETIRMDGALRMGPK
ncbi:SDR family NAD(P)-dependent oxidoreductase [Leucobacter denitrificans]|uniref:SDR family NAD(P)-dependent oxidoreductase n=1 Tax=Leucobacter denitrificans TaxID=683042 RepID=A0A7G9S2Z2_9MICO|nr:SDR family NAD(P)-dependent oxidoreductase [Leucobacter denitrificans]QNN62217.1 SDR family NAD(P)-dependent oxidoreductase [Leucobacter denitrificans]